MARAPAAVRARPAAALAAAALAAVAAAPARAQDRFEIQVYDAETAPPAGAGVEGHGNNVISGTHTPPSDGELPTHGQTHLTLEPHVGVTPWSELGAYIQFAFDPQGDGHWAGFKLRYKLRLPRRLANGLIGLALNLELSTIPAVYEANVWGTELRPIFDLTWRRLYFAFNPIVDIDLAGAFAGRPQLEPALKFSVSIVRGLLAGGIEYYSDFGPVTAFLPAAQQTHRLFGVLDVEHVISPRLHLGVNFGVGYNLTGAGDRIVIKGIIGLGL
jgi:hypothetical protein